MKYIKNPEIVDIVPFEWGMEDGVCRNNQYVLRNAETYPKSMHSTKHVGYLARHDEILDSKCFNVEEGFVPFIYQVMKKFRHVIKENSYIYVDNRGYKRCIGKKWLEKNFTPLVEETQNG